jgi:5-methylcytosine-specific restriction endonuclease McrA
MTTTFGRWSPVSSALGPDGSSRRWRKVRAEVLERDRHTCHWCGGSADTVDHLIPRLFGGTDALDNLVAACGRCNTRRGTGLGRDQAEPSRDW